MIGLTVQRGHLNRRRAAFMPPMHRREHSRHASIVTALPLARRASDGVPRTAFVHPDRIFHAAY